jgi:DNA-binding MarR family transcriptional regulator
MSRVHSRIGVLEELVGYHLRRSSGAFGADFHVAMEGTGLRQVLFGILSVVSSSPGTNQGTVGRLLGIKRANMVSLINELTDLGLLDRVADPQDRRALSLTITKAGAERLEEGLKRIRNHEKRMLADFTEGEKRILLELLRRIEARGPASV